MTDNIFRGGFKKKDQNGNGNVRKLLGRRASAVLLTLVVLTIAIVPRFAMATAELAKNDTGEIEALVSADFKLEDFEISGSTVKGFAQSGLDKLAANPGADLTLPPISGGIVSANAFRGKNLGGTLTIPEGYTAIGDQAFQNCSFNAAVLPTTLSSLGTYAFSGNKLEAVNLSETSLTKINSHAFSGNKLETLTLSAATKEIAAGAFEGNNIKTATLSGVGTIAASAFANNALKEVDLPAISAIAEDAFNGNGQVVKITTPAPSIASHFTSGNGYIINPVTILVSYVDGDGEKIQSDKILGENFGGADLYPDGASVTLEAPAISGYNADKPDSQTVTAAKNLHVTFTYSKNVSTPVITASNQIVQLNSPTIDEAKLLSWVSAVSGFDGSAITDIKVSPSSIATDIEQDIVVTYTATDDYGNKGQKSITVTIAASFEDKYIGNDWQYKDFTYGGAGNLQVTGFSQSGKDKYDNGNTDLILPGYNPSNLNQITSIGEFTGYTSLLSSIDFSQASGLTAIPTSFSRSPLTQLTFGNLPKITSIGGGAFYAARLTELDLSGMPNLTTLPKHPANGNTTGAFENSPLVKLDLSGLTKLTTIAVNTFRSAQLTELDLSGLTSLTTLGDNAFYDANKLEKLNLSGLKELKSIGQAAFFTAPLTNLELDNLPNLTTIGGGAFYAAQLTELDLSGMPELKTLPKHTANGNVNGAFEKSPLVKLDLGGLTKLTTIAVNTFRSAQLTELDLSGLTSLTTLGENAFYNANKLEKLNLSGLKELKSIGQSAFFSAPLTDLELDNLPSLTIIGGGAFFAARLTELDLSGMPELTTLPKHYANGNTAGAFENSPLVELDLGGLTKLNEIAINTFKSVQLTELDLSGLTSLTTLGENAFYNANKLEKLNLSGLKKLKSIGQSAFFNAPLTDLKLDEMPSLTTIGGGAFYTAKLTELDLSGMPNLTTLPEHTANGNTAGAFANSPLVKLDLSGLTKLTTIAINTFRSAQLTELDLSGLESLTTLGTYAFYNANKLEKLNLSGLKKLTSIGQSAFCNAPLTDLKLDDLPSLTTIGGGAFYAAKLTELDLSGMPNLTTLPQHTANGNVTGAFENSPLVKLDLTGLKKLTTIAINTFKSAKLTELDFSSNVSLQTIGQNAFSSSPLNSLDLSKQTQMVSIGPSAFHNSYINSLVIGGFAPRGNGNKYIYNVDPNSSWVITNNNKKLPITILNNDAGIISGYGYIVNPVTLTVRYIDKDSGLSIWPDKKITELSTPLVDYEVNAPAIYGYSVDGDPKQLVNVAVGETQNKTVTFKYTVASVDSSAYELTQTGKHVFDAIGSQLSTYVMFKNVSSPDVNGYKIEISYDPARIKPIAVTGHPTNLYTANLTNPGVVTITINRKMAFDEYFQPAILWSLISGPTEEYLDQPLHAQLIDTSGNAVAAANVISLSGYYASKSYIIKAANGEIYDDKVTWSGEKSELTGHYTNNNVTQKYTFGINNLKRNVSEITFTDTLPTYKASSLFSLFAETTETAKFDPAKNPGWTDNGDGTVTYTCSNLNTTLVPTPRLILDFPNAKPDQDVKNTVSFVAVPYGKAGGETNITGGDSITTKFVEKVAAPSGLSVSKTITMPHSKYDQAWFYDTRKDLATEFRWTVGVIGNSPSVNNLGGNRLPAGDYYKDIVLADSGLDDRMKFTGVDLGVYAPAKVTAYAENGDVLFGSPLQSGVVRFPDAIQENIDRIVVSDSSTTVKSGEAKYVYFLSVLKDPTISYESESAKGAAKLKFWNEGGVVSRTLRSVKTTESGQQYLSEELGAQTMKDDVEIRDMNQGVGIEKKITAETYAHNTVSGLALNYDLALTFYNGNTKTSNDGFDAVLHHVKIVDVLPKYYEMSEFVPSNELILASTGLSYRFKDEGFTAGDGKKYDTLEITADTLDIGKVSELGRLDGTVSYLVPDKTDIVNNIYLDFDADPEVALKVAQSSASIEALATTGLFPLKSIRVEQADGSWGPWSSTGVSTPLGSTFQYRLLIQNNQTDELENISIVDVLPSEGDAEIVASGLRKPRGSGFANVLERVSVVGAPAGCTVEYLTDALPTSYTSADDYFDVDAAAAWKSSVTSGELASVKALRIKADSLPANTGLEVRVTMKAPEANADNNAFAGMRAYNSFASKNNQSTTYAEANTVYNRIPEKPAFVTLTKRANTTGGAFLSGATFGLYTPEGQLVQTADSASAAVSATPDQPAITVGQVTFAIPERGDYEIRELSAPAGYILNEKTYQVKTADFTDVGHTAYYLKSLGNVANASEPVYGNLVLKKVNANDEAIQGVAFRITPPTGPAFNSTTDSKGEIHLNSMPVGNYTIAEQSGAPGKLEKISFTVDVSEASVTGVSNILPAAARGLGLVAKTGDTTVTVKNGLASVDIAKIGVYDSGAAAKAVTDLQPSDGKALSGVQFQLVDGLNQGATIGAPVKTGATGRTSLSGLEVGRLYGLKEISTPLEYEKLTDPVLFKVNKNGRVTDENGEEYVAGLLMVKNLPLEYTGTLKITKTDKVTGLPLDGVSFAVEKQLGVFPYTYLPYGELTTNELGVATLKGIPYGQYRVSEKSGYAGYLTNTTEQYFSVQRYFSLNVESLNSIALSFENVSITPRAIIKGDYVGTYDLSVAQDVIDLAAAKDYLTNTEHVSAQEITNDDGTVTLLAGLAGAQFEIKEYEGMSTDANKLLDTWSAVTSKADGSMDLPSGLTFKEENTYTFTEKVAPVGYTLNPTTYIYQPKSERESIVRNDGKWLAFENRVNGHKLVLTKYASDTQLPLSGVEFELYKADGTLAVANALTTDADGRIVVNDLTTGTYYLKEIKTASGYLFPDGYYKLVIDGSKDAVPVAPPTITDVIDDGNNVIFDDVSTSTGDIFKVIYNTPKNGVDTLTVSKALASGLPASDEAFDFLVQFEGEPYSGPYTLYDFAGDVIGTPKITVDGHIAIKAKQRITVFGRSAGENFTVTEKDHLHYVPYYTVFGNRTDAQGVGGVINGNVSVAVTNEKSVVHRVKFTATAGGSLSGKTEYEAKSGWLWSKAGIVVPTPVPINEHYSFTGWTPAIPSSSLAITQNLTYKANFVVDDHTVTYHGNGQTVGAEPTQTTHKHGAAGVKAKSGETLQKEGYEFIGWSTDSEAKTVTHKVGATLSVENDLDLYAVWAPIEYTVAYLPGEHGTFSPKTVNGLHYSGNTPADTPAAPEATGEDGWKFVGWDKEIASKVTENATYTAIWQAEESPIVMPRVSYTVTYDGNGSTSGSISPVTNLPAGSSHQVLQNAFDRTGYTFLGWSRNAGAKSAAFAGGEKLTINGDVTLYAIWQANVVSPQIVNPPTDTNVSEESEPVVPEGPNFSEFSPEDQQRLEAQTGNILIDFANGNIPLGWFGAKGAWSLLSGIMSIVAAVISIFLVIGVFAKRRRSHEAHKIAYGYEEIKKRRGRGKLLKALTCLAGVATPIVWLILDDLSQPMVWVNKWTLFVGIVFIVHLFLLVVYKLRSTRNDSEYEEEYVA
ncbi:MAG: leucine-rich repeat protein [Clostridiales Family XIII bacterium]|jgi:uncharacterized repeat protein (TIGR02543 family)|nr:leucine-rich repeat protein [Clostridiales Family XIII bacterium]